jgi:hypothetical protein
MSCGRSRSRTVVSAASAPAALPIVDGSVASASINTVGFSARSTDRSKLGGMFTTNRSSPSERPSSAWASDASGRCQPVFLSAATSVRPYLECLGSAGQGPAVQIGPFATQVVCRHNNCVIASQSHVRESGMPDPRQRPNVELEKAGADPPAFLRSCTGAFRSSVK